MTRAPALPWQLDFEPSGRVPPVVHLGDDRLGDLASLCDIDVALIGEIAYVSAIDATTRGGT
ncbi:MAG: hypothetical protein M3081_02690 [Gemmatimonadota bacterium]|nr:hypothetical protein [Gemmatimonadota bacterium]